MIETHSDNEDDCHPKDDVFNVLDYINYDKDCILFCMLENE